MRTNFNYSVECITSSLFSFTVNDFDKSSYHLRCVLSLLHSPLIFTESTEWPVTVWARHHFTPDPRAACIVPWADTRCDLRFPPHLRHRHNSHTSAINHGGRSRRTTKGLWVVLDRTARRRRWHWRWGGRGWITTWWCHDMGVLSISLVALCVGNPPVFGSLNYQRSLQLEFFVLRKNVWRPD